MEFDKSKILTVVTADQAKVGSMGHLSNYIPTLEGYVTGHIKPDKLIRVSLNSIFPFFDGHNYYSLFYPAPEPTYAERQAQWIKENDVKVGTKVKITRAFTEDEDGSCCWAHNDLVGKTGVVDNISLLNLLICMDNRSMKAVPYFALEVIKEPTYRQFLVGDWVEIVEGITIPVGTVGVVTRSDPNSPVMDVETPDCTYLVTKQKCKLVIYRPFKNAEEFKPYRDEWFKKKDDVGFDRAEYYDNVGIKNSKGFFLTYADLVVGYERENGEPCGVREEI